MKLILKANTPRQIVDEIRELAIRQAKIQESTAETTHQVIEKRALMMCGAVLRGFATLIGDVAVEMPLDARLYHAKELLQESIGWLGGEPDGKEMADFFRRVADFNDGIGERPKVPASELQRAR